jgi:hypothetical protein
MCTLNHDHDHDHDTTTGIPGDDDTSANRPFRGALPATLRLAASGRRSCRYMYMYGLRSTTASGSLARVRVIFKLSLNFAVCQWLLSEASF